MLDIKLNTFLKVVELGSYTAAANALHMTQPAITFHISKLEENYGHKFFRQEGRAMLLTEAGEQFLHYAKLQMVNEEQFLERLKKSEPKFHFGSTLSIADYYLPDLISPYMNSPDFYLNLEVANTEILMAKLLSGELDAAFIEGIFDRSLFDSRIFLSPNFVPVVSSSHPLLGKTVSLNGLHDYTLILREQGSGTRAIAENYFRLQNDSSASFNKIWTVGSFALIKTILKSTSAISFMYEAVAKREIENGELSILDIENYSLKHPLHFVYLKNSLRKDKISAYFRSISK